MTDEKKWNDNWTFEPNSFPPGRVDITESPALNNAQPTPPEKWGLFCSGNLLTSGTLDEMNAAYDRATRVLTIADAALYYIEKV